eukprot:1158263-Pelagomonas_calceolata.AAC.4
MRDRQVENQELMHVLTSRSSEELDFLDIQQAAFYKEGEGLCSSSGSSHGRAMCILQKQHLTSQIKNFRETGAGCPRGDTWEATK